MNDAESRDTDALWNLPPAQPMPDLDRESSAVACVLAGLSFIPCDKCSYWDNGNTNVNHQETKRINCRWILKYRVYSHVVFQIVLLRIIFVHHNKRILISKGGPE